MNCSRSAIPPEASDRRAGTRDRISGVFPRRILVDCNPHPALRFACQGSRGTEDERFRAGSAAKSLSPVVGPEIHFANVAKSFPLMPHLKQSGVYLVYSWKISQKGRANCLVECRGLG